MKFIHLADLHIGKYLFNYSLLEIQADLLDQVIEAATAQQVAAIIVAGDVFDRAIAPNEAIKVFSDFVKKAVEHEIKVLVIAGNHDGPARLEYLSSLVVSQGVHIVGTPTPKMAAVNVAGVTFHLLPYLKPIDVRLLFDQDVHNYNEAYQVYLENQNIDSNQTNVLVAHQFFGGNSQTLSEDDLAGAYSVGNSEMVGVDLLDDFAYCALGHIHGSIALKRESCRYGSSLMPLSFDELGQTKQLTIVAIEEGEVTVSFKQLAPLRTLIEVTGSFARLNHSANYNETDFVSVVLTDNQLILNARDRLKLVYPNIMQLGYQNDLTLESDMNIAKPKKGASISEIFADFYAQMHDGEELDAKRQAVIDEYFEKGVAHETN